jgi:transcriptional regulator with XRE-family HTH domain
VDKLSKYVGNKIREFRKKKNLTQKELGDKIGMKHNTISGYENGSSSPEQDTLFKLAHVLDVRVDEFFPPRTGEDSLETVLTKNENLDFEDTVFLKQLIDKVNSLSGEEREKFMDSIRFAVEYFNKMNN